MSGRKSITSGEKKCTGCYETKPAMAFYQKGVQLRSRCKTCYALFNKNQAEKHREKRAAYNRSRGSGWSRCDRSKWNFTEREKHNAYLLRTYGITIGDYETFLEAQGGVCAICRDDCNRRTTNRLCVDHDHQSGLVRGLLCFQCNVGIGKFQENVSHLKSAIEYLENYTPSQIKCEVA